MIISIGHHRKFYRHFAHFVHDVHSTLHVICDDCQY